MHWVFLTFQKIFLRILLKYNVIELQERNAQLMSINLSTERSYKDLEKNQTINRLPWNSRNEQNTYESAVRLKSRNTVQRIYYCFIVFKVHVPQRLLVNRVAYMFTATV